MEFLLFSIGGGVYASIEMLWRGHTHWSMFILGGLCFVIMGLLNEHVFPWELGLFWQSLISATVITVFEFLTGCIVNLWLGWAVWDYSNLPFNLCGQICLQFSLLWILLSAAGIVLDDWIRYEVYWLIRRIYPRYNGEMRKRPRYRLF